MLLREDIQMRDPFIYIEDGCCYLYGTTDKNCWHGTPEGFRVYTSDDLVHFADAGMAFQASPAFWGTQNFWAPELHAWQGAYYLFASFKTPGVCRGTSILRAESPLGPFVPWGDRVVTPEQWECLDGTFHVDGEGNPWVVFCHEWVEIGDGTICARRLRADLSGGQGEALTLFSAGESAWAKQVQHSSGVIGRVTDGPFLYRPASGALWMLWSSLSESGYAMGLARSASGRIEGPWTQCDTPVYSGDGGHGMVFRGLDGQLYITVHTPNRTPDERPLFVPIDETPDGLVVQSAAQRALADA